LTRKRWLLRGKKCIYILCSKWHQ